MTTSPFGPGLVESRDLEVPTLGPPLIDSPLRELLEERQMSVHYAEESDRVLFDDTLSALHARDSPPSELPAFEPAGPRRKIFFDPAKTTAGIVTCGGLCPGLNDIIRGIVTQLQLRYGVTKTYGFRYGYEGLIPAYGHSPMVLKP